MTEGTREKNLLQTLMQKTRLSWKWATISLGAVLLLLLVLAALLDRSPGILLEWEFWHFNLNGILTTVYLVAIYPFVVSLREKAVQAFKPLLPLEKNDFDKIAADIPKPNRWEWAAILPGIIIPIILGEPWNLGWDTFLWLKIHLVTINIIMWCLLCWLIFDLFVSIARITRLSRQDLKLDILDTETLAPIARWSLGISLVIAGGICLNLLFETTESLLIWNAITAYAIVIFALILIFFLSMWGTHRAMSTVKKRKLALARKHLVVISRELEIRSGQDQPGELGTISSELTSWANYQRLIKEAPTWPFNAGIIRQLLASIIVPAVVYLVKILAGLGIRF